jgi:hypothetical protein
LRICVICGKNFLPQIFTDQYADHAGKPQEFIAGKTGRQIICGIRGKDLRYLREIISPADFH